MVNSNLKFLVDRLYPFRLEVTSLTYILRARRALCFTYYTVADTRDWPGPVLLWVVCLFVSVNSLIDQKLLLSSWSTGSMLIWKAGADAFDACPRRNGLASAILFFRSNFLIVLSAGSLPQISADMDFPARAMMRISVQSGKLSAF